MPEPSVRIMISHNYCHFEVCLPIDGMGVEDIRHQINTARELTDEMVEQYKADRKHELEELIKHHEEERQKRIAAGIEEEIPF